MTQLSFASKAEAIAFLDDHPNTQHLTQSNDGTYWYPSGTYYLSHGEYSQPDYKPRRYGDGWGVHVTYYYYAGTLNTPMSGRLDEIPQEWML